jgi:hypothetical protein
MKAAHIGDRIGIVRLDLERTRESVMGLLTLARPNQAVRGSTLVAAL